MQCDLKATIEATWDSETPQQNHMPHCIRQVLNAHGVHLLESNIFVIYTFFFYLSDVIFTFSVKLDFVFILAVKLTEIYRHAT